jgi:hypothetical protein
MFKNMEKLPFRNAGISAAQTGAGHFKADVSGTRT